MTLTECKRALAELDHKPSKSLGQNFLIDQNILRIVVQAAEVGPRDVVWEIGAGLGVLTQALLEQGAHVIAVEKDERLVGFLRQRFAHRKKLELIHADALELDVSATVARSGGGTTSLAGCKLVANLPYSVSTAILKRFVEWPQPPGKIVVMLQREVAGRLAARPGTADYGMLTVFTRARYRVSLRHIVSRRCFYPAPEVDSAVVAMDYAPHPLLEECSRERFVRLVQVGFGQRRKQFAKLLRQAGWEAERIAEAFAAVGLPLTTRAEAVSVDQFLNLARKFSDGRNL